MINSNSVMMLPGYGGGFMLPTRNNRFVIVLAPYPSQQVTTFQIFRCGLIEEQMANVAHKWDAADLEAAGQQATCPSR